MRRIVSLRPIVRSSVTSVSRPAVRVTVTRRVVVRATARVRVMRSR